MDDILKVKKNERNLVLLFSKPKKTNLYTRYFDDELKDMYDHNYFEVNNVDEKLLNELYKIKQENKEGHLKISSNCVEKYLKTKDFMEDITLTMLKSDYLNFNIKERKGLIFKNLTEDDILDDITSLELLEYGDIYGRSFVIRRMNRYASKILEKNNGLNYHACYLGNLLVAYCYTYFDEGVVGLDGLLVRKEYRHQGIASSLLKYIASLYNCPIYLHAEEEDYPQHIYENLGFKIIDKSYDYLIVD